MAQRKVIAELPSESDPEESIQELVDRLELYKGQWAILFKGDLYVFPAETTKKMAEGMLRDAYDYYRNRSN